MLSWCTNIHITLFLTTLLVQESLGVPGVVLPPDKCRKLSFNGSKEHEDERKPDHELENIVGPSDSSQLEVLVQVQAPSLPSTQLLCIILICRYSIYPLLLQEMTPPSMLQCELRPYQKQALHWMVQMEKGRCLKEAATTLHPCWDAYRLADKYAKCLSIFPDFT